MKEIYDYKEAIVEDVISYINENEEYINWDNNIDDIEHYIYDECNISDTVTGNASGSYWCNSSKASECLYGNMDLLLEAIGEFNDLEMLSLQDIYNKGVEWGDCIIRIYILPYAMNDKRVCTLISELKNNHNK